MAGGLNLKGITVEIGGDTSNLQSALKNVNGEISNLQQNLRTINSALKLDPTNVTALAQKQKLLTEAVEQTRQKLETLKLAQQQADATIAKGGEVDAQAYRNLMSEIARTEASMNGYQNELKQTEVELKNVESGSKGAADGTDKLGNELDDTKDSTDKAASAAEKLQSGYTVLKNVVANLVTEALQKLGQTLKDVSAYVWESGTAYETNMSKVRAVTGATAEEMTALGEKAFQSAEKSVYSTDQVAEAYTYMGMAGWKSGQMIAGIDPILALAASSEMDLGRASDIVTDGLTAMGYKATDAAKFVDVLAATSSNSNTNVEMMGETFKYAGSLAGALRFSIDDLAIATGLMANAGIKGAQAGTSLRGAFTNLANPTAAQKAAMDSLGLSITDSDGRMLSLMEIMQRMRVSFAGLGVDIYDAEGNLKDYDTIMNEVSATEGGYAAAQKVSAAATIFGKNALSGMLAIVNASDEDFKTLTGAINNSTGAAQTMANVMLDNVGGDVDMLKSKVNVLATELFEKLSPSIRQVVQGFTAWLNTKDVKVLIDQIATALAAIVTGVAAHLPALLTAISNGLTFVSTHGKEIIEAIKGVAIAIASLKGLGILANIVSIGSGIAGLATKVGGFLGVLKTVVSGIGTVLGGLVSGPIGAIVAAIAGVVAAIALLWNKCEWFRNGVTAIWDGIKNGVKVAVDAIQNTFKAMGDAIVSLWNGLKTSASTIWNGITSAITTAVNTVKTALITGWNTITSTLSNLWNGIRNTASNVWNGITSAISNAVNTVRNTVTNVWNSITSTLSNTWTNLTTRATTAFRNIGSTIVNTFTALPSRLLGIGKNIVEGLWNGINGAGSWIKEKITGFGKGILDNIKGVLGIHSPSTETAWMGDMLTQGLGEGLDRSENWIDKKVDSFSQGILGRLSGLTDASMSVNGITTMNGITGANGAGSGSSIEILLDKIDHLCTIVQETGSKPVYIGKRQLVGAIADEMDTALGEIANRRMVNAL